MDNNNNIGKPHAIVFPYPYQGHITPMMNLVTNLASKGFTITYVQLEHIHHTISKARGDASDDLFVEARKMGLDIRYTTMSDGFSLDFMRDAKFTEYWESMINDFPDCVDETLGRIISESDDNDAFFLIADFTYSWPATIAMKHNLVNVAFSPGSALLYLIGYYFPLLIEKGHLSNNEGGGDSSTTVVDCIPGVLSLSTKDLMCIQVGEATPTMAKIWSKATEQAKNADFLVFNTVQELEPNSLGAINQKQPAYAIGPFEFFNGSKTMQQSMWAASDCTQWLESKPRASVLYISFGSIAELSKHETEELAHGLVLSQVNFIWVVRRTSSTAGTDDDFPVVVGFEDAVRERGLVVPWCNQKEVLAHAAVGGFVTHCGWNSVVESMWNGVPMICYPFYVDQPTNRKLVVDDLKIGVDLVGEHGAIVTKEEVVSKIDILIKGTELREEAKKVSLIMRNAALHHDGSSRRNFDQFVHHLKARLESRSNNTTSSNNQPPNDD